MVEAVEAAAHLAHRRALMAVRVVALGVQAPAVLAVQETRQVPHPHKELMVVAHQPQAHIPLVVEAVQHQQGRRVLVLLAGLVVLVQHHQYQVVL